MRLLPCALGLGVVLFGAALAAAAPPGAAPGAAAAASSSKAPPPRLPFDPSNVARELPAANLVGDLVFRGRSCEATINDEVWGPLGCKRQGARYVLREVTLSDGTRAQVVYARSIRVEADAVLRVRGPLPTILVAADSIDIAGTIDLSGNAPEQSPRSGGAPSPKIGATDVTGLGPGGGGVSRASAGGAGFCARGGSSGDDSAQGGAAYGTPELVPLVGGSSGGGKMGGSGGGAMQLVAGRSIRIARSGVLTAGGAGGPSQVLSSSGSGGGSGGAFLLEAPEVVVDGTIAVNGGAGGAGGGGPRGEGGKPNAERARGGASDGLFKMQPGRGGAGGAGATAAGDRGEPGLANAGAGHGGGSAGRIRINAKTLRRGNAAVLSPAPDTACTTFGSLP